MDKPVALITGASRGIGKAIALTLADEGYDLVVTCKSNEALLSQVVESITDKGVRCLGLRVDSGNYDEVEALFNKHIKPTFHRLDLLVNNAGVSYIGLLTDMSPKDWANVMHTNLDSLYNTCKFAVPMMVMSKSGNIINISSIWGNEGASCEVAYSASKGAVNSFTKALSKELAPSHIRVNAIACGAIDTDMNQWLSAHDRKTLEEDIGLGRLGAPEEIAETVAYLTSKKASYITGQIIRVDGGI